MVNDNGKRYNGLVVNDMMKKKQPPSKIRYDKNHPVISFRLSIELKEKLEKYITQRNLSYADFVKMALETRQTEEATAFKKGYEMGERGAAKELQPKMSEIQNKIEKVETYIRTLEQANQSLAIRNQQLEALVNATRKKMEDLDMNDLDAILDLVHKRELDILKRRLNNYP